LRHADGGTAANNNGRTEEGLVYSQSVGYQSRFWPWRKGGKTRTARNAPPFDILKCRARKEGKKGKKNAFFSLAVAQGKRKGRGVFGRPPSPRTYSRNEGGGKKKGGEKGSAVFCVSTEEGGKRKAVCEQSQPSPLADPREKGRGKRGSPYGKSPEGGGNFFHPLLITYLLQSVGNRQSRGGGGSPFSLHSYFIFNNRKEGFVPEPGLNLS